MTTPSNQRIAVIGAGMAGITLANKLHENGRKPTIFEKSHDVGGRLATRHEETGGTFDHGAQFITTRAKDFRDFIGAAIKSGTAAQWRPTEKSGWAVGTPTMNAMLKPLAEAMDIHYQTAVTSIKRKGEQWELAVDNTDKKSLFDIVISTAPAPQTMKFVDGEVGLTEVLRHIGIMPCWSLMIRFSAPFEPGFKARRFKDSDISWVSQNGSKPSRPDDPDCWTVHASPAWSAQNLELNEETIADLMLEKLSGTTDAPLPSITYAKAHRWRYAQTSAPLGQPYLCTADQTFFAGGDWCLGARVECAYESGVAIAEAILNEKRVNAVKLTTETANSIQRLPESQPQGQAPTSA